ncbi:hypothetical protein GCM10027405_37450 [Arthrobacter alkaliphilus]
MDEFARVVPEAYAVINPNDCGAVTVRLKVTAAGVAGIPFTPPTWKDTVPSGPTGALGRVSRSRTGEIGMKAPAAVGGAELPTTATGAVAEPPVMAAWARGTATPDTTSRTPSAAATPMAPCRSHARKDPMKSPKDMAPDEGKTPIDPRENYHKGRAMVGCGAARGARGRWAISQDVSAKH